MRFIIGPPPDDSDFAPEDDGWRKLREPGPFALVLIGSVVGIPLAALVNYGWSQIPGFESGIQFSISPEMPPWAVVPLLILSPFLFFATVIIVHEFIHDFACPGLGLTRATVLGFWPGRCLPYACHLGPMPSWRGVIVAMAPFLVLSVAPFLAALMGGPQSTLVALVSVCNALLCGGDTAICILMIAQTGLGAAVRNKGWDTWWRPTESGASA